MSPEPRKRTMPLVPEPFSEVCISRQSVFSMSQPMAESWCRFCPNLDIPQYKEGLSEEKQTELDKRANKLFKRAINNQLYKSSEFCWEVCAWHDVFGLILDDEGLRMDKRPYEFVEKDDSGQRTVRTRIPDATFGLKSYDDYYLKRGYVCTVPDCKEDHSNKQPDKRLSEKDLRAMMNDPDCGLIVDGVWGRTDLLFPFAVYEAKKRARDYGAAENQIYHACRTYLAMLDDLARDPNNVAEYQTEKSSEYQLFAFTSCGPYWEVYIAWKFLDTCTVETIWEGDIMQFSRAYDLVCLVDQIHDYVVNHHRNFVMKHLEAWYARHHSLTSPTPSTSLPHDEASDDKRLKEVDMRVALYLKYLLGPAKGEPEWLRLKEETNESRRQKAQNTRLRNRKLREAIQKESSEELLRTKPRRGRRPTAGVDKKGGSSKLPEKKRGRGRPPKGGVARKEAPKRGRGRPPKTNRSKKET